MRCAHWEGNTVNEYVIHAKLKNNLILARILAVAPTVAAFCERNGLSQTAIGNYIAMKKSALTKAGEWRADARKLADALCVDVSEIFTDEQARAELQSNEAYVEMSRQQALACVDPLRAIDQREFVARLLDRAQNLNTRERMVLSMRFGLDDGEARTLDTIGDALGVTRVRVDQIEQKALRKLRFAAAAGDMIDDGRALIYDGEK